MFFSFSVQERDRDVLCFLWFLDNNFNNDIVDFHMKVQVFGNSPSPAVAIFGLRKAAWDVENKFGSDVWQFMKREFYMDGALFPAVDVLKRAR